MSALSSLGAAGVTATSTGSAAVKNEAASQMDNTILLVMINVRTLFII